MNKKQSIVCLFLTMIGIMLIGNNPSTCFTTFAGIGLIMGLGIYTSLVTRNEK